MPVAIDDIALHANSRPAAIALATFTMRCMEHWKKDVVDYDRAMILVSVVAISSGRLLRADLSPEERQLPKRIEPAKLAKCNVSSIASATGINRETVRRKVSSLVEQGLLRRDDDGAVEFAPGILQQESTFALVRRQLEAVARLANELQRLGVLKQQP